MRKKLDNIKINDYLIDLFKPIFLMADTKVLLSVIEVLSNAKGGCKVKKEEFGLFYRLIYKSLLDSFCELKSYNFCFVAEDDIVKLLRLEKEEKDDAADAL